MSFVLKGARLAAYVYILKCCDDRYYYGSTNDLTQRVA